MKQALFFFILCTAIIFIDSSCQKQINYPIGKSPIVNDGPAIDRKIVFSLYTDKNLASIHPITFTVVIRKPGHEVIWDSVFAPMNVKDIPNFANRIIIEKSVSQKDSSILQVGFLYSIEDVGFSWHLDTISKSTPLKHLDFNFR